MFLVVITDELLAAIYAKKGMELQTKIGAAVTASLTGRTINVRSWVSSKQYFSCMKSILLS